VPGAASTPPPDSPPRPPSTYAVGDVHGCFASLEALLARLPFETARDRLWLVGDLVNRGPDNVAVLRWARQAERRLGERFVCVLGNHDLHLLRRAAGLRTPRPLDTVDDVLTAADREELLGWLARRPLLHVDPRHSGTAADGGRVLVHAGLPPGRSLDETMTRAAEAESWLADPARRATLLAARTDPEARRRAGNAADTLDLLPTLRTVDAAGRPCDHSGPPDDAPAGCLPWFRHPHRPAAELTVFGHWSALGFHREDGVLGLDSGCVWGGGLTAVRLEDGAVFHQPTVEAADLLPGDAVT
jgi:bis(5'-nucleosyl)-tetraphosphatase (symmetrical)